MSGATRLAVSGRALVLVAGMPGAGKSTLLAGLPSDPRVVVLDSDVQRAALRRVFGALPYRRYRGLVHGWHRLAVLVAALSDRPVVVVHLPATGRGTRDAVARIAALTDRSAHLVWLHVDAAEARRGQEMRGRLVPQASFTRHAAAAARVPVGEPGWADLTVLDRAQASGGLVLDPPGRRRPVVAQ